MLPFAIDILLLTPPPLQFKFRPPSLDWIGGKTFNSPPNKILPGDTRGNAVHFFMIQVDGWKYVTDFYLNSPLISCSGRVPGSVHIAGAKWLNTAASTVESLEPMRYFLSP